MYSCVYSYVTTFITVLYSYGSGNFGIGVPVYIIVSTLRTPQTIIEPSFNTRLLTDRLLEI